MQHEILRAQSRFEQARENRQTLAFDLRAAMRRVAQMMEIRRQTVGDVDARGDFRCARERESEVELGLGVDVTRDG